MKTVLGIVYASHSTIYAICINSMVPGIQTQYFINKVKTYVPDIVSQLPPDPTENGQSGFIPEPNIYTLFITSDDVDWQTNGGITHLQFETVLEQGTMKPGLWYKPIDNSTIVEYLQKDALLMMANYQSNDTPQMQTFIQDAKSLLYQDANGQIASNLKLVDADGLKQLIINYKQLGNQVAQ